MKDRVMKDTVKCFHAIDFLRSRELLNDEDVARLKNSLLVDILSDF